MRVGTEEEAELLAAVARGQQGALEDLYDRYERRLYGLGVRLLGERGLAEELVQETFVRLWQMASRFDPQRGSAATFIYTVARRIAIDLWRRPSSRPFDPSAEGESPDPIEDVVTSLAVRDALDSLSDAHREVIELVHGQGMRQRETAELLGVPAGTVKTRVYYALRALRLALQERGVDA